MRKGIFYLSLVTCFFWAQNVAAQNCSSCPMDNNDSGCCPAVEQSCCPDTSEQMDCSPQPTNCYPTVCYKPYVYYTPKKHYQRQCCDVQVPCKKTCCRMVPQYYEQTHCKMVPQYYKTQHCKMVPEYYEVEDCKTCKQYYTTCSTSYEPHYFYKKCCGYDNSGCQ